MDELSISLSLLALTACLAHGGWLTICLARGRGQIAASLVLTALLLSCALLLSVGANWLTNSSFPGLTFNHLLVLLAVGAWLTVRLGWAWFDGDDRNVVRWRACGAAHALLVAAAAWNFYTITHDNPIDLVSDQQTRKVPVEDAVLVTDQGRIFSVFRFDTDNQVFKDVSHNMFQDKIVRVASPDLQTNCHGWVFANGRYAIPEAAVAALLQDNGYSLALSPLPGDVIVYRDKSGSIVHSGRVRRVHDNGQVWIESKWGPAGRYLHLPEDQCYSRSFAYYRSARLGHEAQIVRTPTTNDARMARSDNTPPRRAKS
jgi:hypothetical protein